MCTCENVAMLCKRLWFCVFDEKVFKRVNNTNALGGEQLKIPTVIEKLSNLFQNIRV